MSCERERLARPELSSFPFALVVSPNMHHQKKGGKKKEKRKPNPSQVHVEILCAHL